MAVNAYLLVDGINGPSTSLTNAIDVLSYSIGVSQTSTYGAGASGKEAKAGRADFANLTITKVLDATTPLLADACESGDVIKSVQLLYYKPIGTAQQAYYRIYLGDAMVTGVQQSGSNENPAETISFAFQQIEWAYKPENDDGTLGAATPKGFDLGTLKSDYAAPSSF